MNKKKFKKVVQLSKKIDDKEKEIRKIESKIKYYSKPQYIGPIKKA